MIGETKTHQQHLLMAPSEVAAIDDWRFKNRIRSRGEAIRRLCQTSLAYAAMEGRHEARIAELEEALRPFAATAEVDIGLTEADDDIFQQSRHNRAPKITVGDFRRAYRALHTEGE